MKKNQNIVVLGKETIYFLYLQNRILGRAHLMNYPQPFDQETQKLLSSLEEALKGGKPLVATKYRIDLPLKSKILKRNWKEMSEKGKQFLEKTGRGKVIFAHTRVKKIPTVKFYFEKPLSSVVIDVTNRTQAKAKIRSEVISKGEVTNEFIKGEYNFLKELLNIAGVEWVKFGPFGLRAVYEFIPVPFLIRGLKRIIFPHRGIYYLILHKNSIFSWSKILKKTSEIIQKRFGE